MIEGADMNSKHSSDFVVIKAVEDGVNVIGLTRGTDTKFHHSEKLDKGEVIIAQFTEHTSAIKVRGNALIQTAYGEMNSEKNKPAVSRFCQMPANGGRIQPISFFML